MERTVTIRKDQTKMRFLPPRTEAKPVAPPKSVIINLGGEGEIPGAINVNLSVIRDPEWRAARDGVSTVKDVKNSGPVIIAAGNHLPFKTGAADEVVCNSAPIGDHSTWLGPAYKPSEMNRITKQGGVIRTDNATLFIYSEEKTELISA